IVFLAGERAYKLKRAVRFPYLDYSTVERRRAMCEAELAINRRTAPSLYLEVRAIIRGANGELGLGAPQASACDWVLVMRRFPQSDLLEQVRRQGRLDRRIAHSLAEVIAAFHARAARTPQFGGVSGIARVLEENEQILKSMTERPFGSERIAQLSSASTHWLERSRSLLEKRRAGGFVRRCHGDLHLNNICLLD